MGAIHIERESENRRLLLSFVKSIQERDLVTYEHSRRVATYAYRLARQLGWSRREASNLALAALVHDLGKTWIANNILNKSAALSAEERRTIERHPVTTRHGMEVAILQDCEAKTSHLAHGFWLWRMSMMP